MIINHLIMLEIFCFPSFSSFSPFLLKTNKLNEYIIEKVSKNLCSMDLHVIVIVFSNMNHSAGSVNKQQGDQIKSTDTDKILN